MKTMRSSYVQRKLLEELTDRSPISALGGIFLFFLLVISCRFDLTNPFLAVCSVLTIVSNGGRLLLISNVKKNPNLVGDYFKTVLISLILFSGTIWSALGSWVFLHYKFGQFENNVTLLVFSGTAASALVSFSADLWVLRSFLALIIIIPVIAFNIPEGSEHVLPYTLISLLYMVFLCQQGKGYYQSLVQKFENEVQLEEKRSLLQTILDAVPGHLSYFDKQLRYVSMNSNLRKALGVQETEYVGKDVGVYHSEGLWLNRLREFVASDLEVDVFEYQNMAQADKRWYLANLRKDPDKTWIVSVSVDIHQEKQLTLEAEAQRHRTEISEKMAVLGEMSSGIAHEINNPLAIILGKAQLIERAMNSGVGVANPQVIVKDSEVIRSTVDRITKIVRGLQKFARDGRQDPFSAHSIFSILDDTLSLCSSRFKSNGIELYVDPVPKTLEMECRSIQISQVLLNLLNNSFDAVFDLSEKWVRISVTCTETTVRFRVTDSGLGIPEELRSKIISPFFTTKGVGKGTGLGLSISYGIVRSHGGTLELDVDSKHTSFVVELPKTHELSA